MKKYLLPLIAFVAASLQLLPIPLQAEDAPKELTVFAAASLVNAFKDIGKSFEAAHPGVKVTFSFAGSQQLRAQVEEGATPDVFASANLDEIKALTAKKFVDEKASTVFVRNKLVIAVSSQSAMSVKSLKDLATPKLKIVLADGSVPVGKYTLKFLDAATKDASLGEAYKTAVLGNVVSYETNVRSVLTKVALGEADAGIVYSSDLSGIDAGKVYSIHIPDALNQIAQYPIASLAKSPNAALAHEFVEAVLSAQGKKVLHHYGFITE